MTRWKLRGEYFKGANTYKMDFNGNERDRISLDLVVDENGYFELDGPAPNGFYAFAKLAPYKLL